MIHKTREQSRWEEVVRSKLEDWEAETTPEDWEAIAERLPGMKRISFFPFMRRYAAAVIALLLVSAGGYLYYGSRTYKPHVVVTSGGKTESTGNAPTNPPASSHVAVALPAQESDSTPSAQPVRKTPTVHNIPTANAYTAQVTTPEEPSDIPSDNQAEDNNPENTHPEEPAQAAIQSTHPKENHLSDLMADATSKSKHSRKRWSFGAGGGSYSVSGSEGSGGVGLLSFADASPIYNAELNPHIVKIKEERRNISHKRPLSFGMGVSYALNDRWALQSGLTYTLLRSDWVTFSDYLGEARQQLHFIGIPLGANYRIAEWKRFRLYATGGLMTEWNVAGRIRTDYYIDGEKIRTDKESIRMKEWQWSVNARAGISYPLIRFVNAYVEGGAGYYFDNGSFIETIRSDKPFHVSLQAGIRLGF